MDWKKIGRTLEAVGDDIGRKAEDIMDRAGKGLDSLATKVEENAAKVGDLGSGAKKKASKSFDSPIMAAYFGAAKETAKYGKDKTIAAVKAVGVQYNDKLDSMVNDKPHWVGVHDGVYQAFTSEEVKRSKKQEYLKGVGKGTTLGYGAAAVGFVFGSLPVALASLVPVGVRVAPKVKEYVGERAQEADAKYAAEQKAKEE
ncbi:hypothetical protein HOK51_01435 [Candidatus Woesearchaeota archaeon]|jgi:hypothetical protein|nr:hypothetical protein [Candidatus Woesearchaeota archaeon]MBT7366988.1 hypothetical protein [Candidatus Woesearchaeota archaeon]